MKMVKATVIRGDATVYYRVWNLEYINYTARTNWNCRTYLTYGRHPQLSQRAASATQQPYRGKSSTYRTWWWWEMHWPGMETTQVTCYIQDTSQHLWFYKKRPSNPLFLYEFRNVIRQTPRTYEKCNQNHSHCTALHTQKCWEECERSSWWCFVPPLGCIVISFSW